PDGTIIWTAPSRRVHTTHPGSRVLFPQLCTPTTPVAQPDITPRASTGLMMPRRKHTREYHRQRSIEAERRLNDDRIAERNKPPPF
ncbi:HNH endonuclease, partial [Mycobacterium sp. NPDC048908]